MTDHHLCQNIIVVNREWFPPGIYVSLSEAYCWEWLVIPPVTDVWWDVQSCQWKETKFGNRTWRKNCEPEQGIKRLSHFAQLLNTSPKYHWKQSRFVSFLVKLWTDWLILLQNSLYFFCSQEVVALCWYFQATTFLNIPRSFILQLVCWNDGCPQSLSPVVGQKFAKHTSQQT